MLKTEHGEWVNTIEITPASPGTLCTGGAGAVGFKKVNGEATWIVLDQFCEAAEHIIDATASPDGATLYALTHLLYRGSDTGMSWQCLLRYPGRRERTADQSYDWDSTLFNTYKEYDTCAEEYTKKRREFDTANEPSC